MALARYVSTRTRHPSLNLVSNPLALVLLIPAVDGSVGDAAVPHEALGPGRVSAPKLVRPFAPLRARHHADAQSHVRARGRVRRA